MSRERPRVLYVEVIPTPYRAPLLTRIAAELDHDMEVVFCDRPRSFRSWGELALPFPHRFLRSVGVKVPGSPSDRQTFAPGVVLHLLRTRPAALVAPGWFDPTVLLAICTARLLRIPYVIASESHARRPRSRTAPVFRALIAGPVVRSAAAVMATGTLARDYAIGLGADPERTFIRPNACDVDAVAAAARSAREDGSAAALRRELAGDLPLVCYVGRLVAIKGVDVLLAALATLRRRGREVACVIAGDGPERASLMKQAHALELDHVTFLSEVRPEDLPRVYEAADVSCLPSLDEPWGVVVNESLSTGTPVVVSAVVGAGPDLVVEGATGAVAPAGDPEGLADGLLRALAITQDPAEMMRVVRTRDYDVAVAGMRSALTTALSPSGAAT